MRAIPGVIVTIIALETAKHLFGLTPAMAFAILLILICLSAIKWQERT